MKDERMNEYVVEVNDKAVITIENFAVRCEDMFIQREMIVRCRVCKWFVPGCTNNYCDYFKHVIKSPNGFCAWGRRLMKGG